MRPPQSAPASGARHSAPAWLRALLVVVEVELGLLLLALPWTPLWTHSAPALRWGAAHGWLLSYYARGAVSGLGIANIWLATSEITPFAD